ncbi:unnamed protein product [Owenia fusiformis]|uniref:Uncharacterized protein n=1 Tax=Owenia fusiformis TaxID=6347 RepID=A0A8J1TRM7_OWEFU|nr:unnamed protein product [Owenia fusiformis]
MGIGVFLAGCLIIVPIVTAQQSSGCDKALFQQELGEFLNRTNGTDHGAAHVFLESEGAAFRRMLKDNPNSNSLTTLLGQMCHVLNKTAEAAKSIVMSQTTGCVHRDVFRADNTIFSKFATAYKHICNKSEAASPTILNILSKVNTSCLTGSQMTAIDKCSADLDAQQNRTGRPDPDDPSVNRTLLELEGNKTCRFLMSSTSCVKDKFKSIRTCNSETKKFLSMKRMLLNKVPFSDGFQERVQKFTADREKIDFNNKENRKKRASIYFKSYGHLTFRDPCSGKRKNQTVKLAVGEHTFLKDNNTEIKITVAELSSGGPVYITNVQLTMTGRDGSTIVDKQTDCTTTADLAASLTSSNPSTPAVTTVGDEGSSDETDVRAPKPKINVIRSKKRGVHILLQKAEYENSSGVKTRFCMIGARIPAKLFENAMSGLAVSGVPDDNVVDTSNVGSTRRKRATSCASDDVVCNYDSAYATVESITTANSEFNEEDAAVESEDQEVTDAQGGAGGESASAVFVPTTILLVGAILLTMF